MNGKIIINKNILITVAIVAVLLIGGIVAYIIITGDDRGCKGYPPKPPTSQTSQTEVSLNGIDVGIDLDKLQELLGQPKSRENMGNYEIYSYENLKVEVRDKKVYALMTDSPGVTTVVGIQVGSSYDDMVSRYGSDYKDHFDKLMIYEYSKPALYKQDGVLIFSVDSQDPPRIVNIIARLKDEGIVVYPEAEQAKLALHKFVNTIARDESEIRRAYRDMLTNHYKASVTEDIFVKMSAQFSALNFTKEFQVQKATPNSVVLTFEAESRTPVPEGILYKHWVGEIKMANEVDVWKIDNVKAENDLTVLEAPKE